MDVLRHWLLLVDVCVFESMEKSMDKSMDKSIDKSIDKSMDKRASLHSTLSMLNGGLDNVNSWNNALYVDTVNLSADELYHQT
jgi:hypothetical protein